MASSAICWPRARFSGLPTIVVELIEVHQAGLVKPNRGFCFQYFQNGGIQPGLRDFAALHGLQHGFVRGIKIGRDDQDIVASFEGVHGSAADVVGVETGEAGHIQCVGDDESLETELVFQQVGDNSRRS